jgi:hypothetical protein
MSEPNDIVDVGADSFPQKGRVHDCFADGKLIAIVTGSAVSIIDTDKGTAKEVSGEGGDRVAVGSGWIAWAQGPSLQLESLK